MTKNPSVYIAAIMLLATLEVPLWLAAQEPQEQQPKHHHYKFVDLGTLGGAHSYGSVNGEGFRLVNNSGVVASYADTQFPDPNKAFGCYVEDCLQAHAAKWKHGQVTDLGALPGNNNSAAGSINSRGWATGQSQTSTTDPIVGIPEYRGVLWKDGQVIDLGTLGSGTESLGIYVNDAGQAVGFSTVNTESDPLGFFGFPTHTFIWENGSKVDIGTLGGSDAFPSASCSDPPEGLVVGASTTSAMLNPDTSLPTVEPFLWQHGKMISLGTLGGTVGSAQCANHRRQVVGISSVPGNPGGCIPAIVFGNPAGPGCHAFLWQNGVMKDLGTLGGDASEAIWLNEVGEVAGSSDLPGGKIHHAAFWKDSKIHDLGTVSGDACSRSRGLNVRGQVVGGSSDCSNFLHAFLWETSGPAVDLNTMIEGGSGFQLTNAFNINDRGEILAKAAPVGFTPSDDADLGHLTLLIPCDENHPGIEGCDYSVVEETKTVALGTLDAANPAISTAVPIQTNVQTALLRLTGGTPPAGVVGTEYGSYVTEYFSCRWNPVLGWHLACFRCDPSIPGSCPSKYGNCFSSPCLRTSQVLVPFTFTATGGIKPYMWSSTEMPPGLSLDSSSGAVSGKPTVAGKYTVQVSVIDAEDPPGRATAGFAIQIQQ